MAKEMKRRLLRMLAMAAAVLMATPGISALAALPESVTLYRGGTAVLPASAMFEARMEGDGQAAAMEKRGGSGVTVLGLAPGKAELTYRLLGALPVKRVSLTVSPRRMLIPGGQSVGVAIGTKGLIVVGESDLGQTPSPARVAGIKPGDIIRSLNGTEVDSAEALTRAVNSGESIDVEIQRAGKRVSCRVTPALDARDGSWRLGAWVRDSTAGIGTLTFVDPESRIYGALGHAITDVDTRIAMPVGDGTLYENGVVDVTPGQSGAPGELTGDFVFHSKEIGTVTHNTDRGIYGEMAQPEGNRLYPDGLPAAGSGDVHPGRATLLTTVEGDAVREYECEIVRMNPKAESPNKAMVVRVTDPELLERTGGIVQGMSGSPLIQDGMIVGAITHVMVNDPAMGYAICIDSMLNAADSVKTDHSLNSKAAA